MTAASKTHFYHKQAHAKSSSSRHRSFLKLHLSTVHETIARLIKLDNLKDRRRERGRTLTATTGISVRKIIYI